MLCAICGVQYLTHEFARFWSGTVLKKPARGNIESCQQQESETWICNSLPGDNNTEPASRG